MIVASIPSIRVLVLCSMRCRYEEPGSFLPSYQFCTLGCQQTYVAFKKQAPNYCMRESHVVGCIRRFRSSRWARFELVDPQSVRYTEFLETLAAKHIHPTSMP